MDKREGAQLEDMKIIDNSITELKANLEAMDQRMADTRGKMHTLREAAEKEGAFADVRSLLSLLESLKALEKQEAEIESSCSKKCSKLQSELSELDEMILSHDDGKNFAKRIDDSLACAVERLNSVKMELASKLREIVSLKRRRDDVPTQAELIQYERRFSELNIHIQRKLQQTRKFYATYNALLEIKELMLKETSLLNSISSQFQDAFSTPTGRATLISSMDGIEKSIQQRSSENLDTFCDLLLQKLQNVQITLQVEQRACEALREKHTAANSEKRRCYSLLKAFQEECAKNERLRSQTSEVHV